MKWAGSGWAHSVSSLCEKFETICPRPDSGLERSSLPRTKDLRRPVASSKAALPSVKSCTWSVQDSAWMNAMAKPLFCSFFMRGGRYKVIFASLLGLLFCFIVGSVRSRLKCWSWSRLYSPLVLKKSAVYNSSLNFYLLRSERKGV